MANRNEATSKNAQQQQERLAHRQCGEPLALAIEERISADHKRALPQLVQGCEDLVEVSFGACVHDMKLQSMSALLADAGLRSLLHGYPMDNAECQREK